MKLLFFGITKDIIGKRELSDYELNEASTVGDLLHQLKNDYPKLRDISSLAIGVNQKYASLETKLNTEDEVALIPPVSGG